MRQRRSPSTPRATPTSRGFTQSPDFPTTAGAFDRTGAASNNLDAFVSKLNPTGTALVYSTFLGGSDFEFGPRHRDRRGRQRVRHRPDEVVELPDHRRRVRPHAQHPANCPRCAIDNTDGFVTKLNAAGSALVYSTYLGGTDIDDAARDRGRRRAATPTSTGETLSTRLPDDGGRVQPRRNGGVRRVRHQAQRHRLGARLLDPPRRHAGRQRRGHRGRRARQRVRASASRARPTSRRRRARSTRPQNGGFDVTLTKLNAAGSALVYSTFLGGSGPRLRRRRLRRRRRQRLRLGRHRLARTSRRPPGAFDRPPTGATRSSRSSTRPARRRSIRRCSAEPTATAQAASRPTRVATPG